VDVGDVRGGFRAVVGHGVRAGDEDAVGGEQAQAVAAKSVVRLRRKRAG